MPSPRQATVAGYRASLLAATHLGKFLPMFMTAAGTIPPGKVLILGAGVAGLQAIATARRLGAVVEAFDIRPAVKEQVPEPGRQVPGGRTGRVGRGRGRLRARVVGGKAPAGARAHRRAAAGHRCGHHHRQHPRCACAGADHQGHGGDHAPPDRSSSTSRANPGGTAS